MCKVPCFERSLTAPVMYKLAALLSKGPPTVVRTTSNNDHHTQLNCCMFNRKQSAESTDGICLLEESWVKHKLFRSYTEFPTQGRFALGPPLSSSLSLGLSASLFVWSEFLIKEKEPPKCVYEPTKALSANKVDLCYKQDDWNLIGVENEARKICWVYGGSIASSEHYHPQPVSLHKCYTKQRSTFCPVASCSARFIRKMSLFIRKSREVGRWWDFMKSILDRRPSKMRLCSCCSMA